MSKIYLIGSLRNTKVPEIASKLRDAGHEVFDDWYAAGPEADDYWQKYESLKGNNYKEGLAGYAAKHVYNFDKFHLDRNDIGVLVLPAGKSGHLELGYMIGKGKVGYILFDEAMPADRWDVMYQFATGVHFTLDSLIAELKTDQVDNSINIARVAQK
jgi:nucleoside 2-deoxyribosyltransferase